MIDTEILAYLAGAMDSDGSFGIKRSTYAMRVRGDAGQPVFSERASLKQTTIAIPELLKTVFGGTLRLESPSTKNGKPLWGWTATCRKAANVARQLLPYLRIKGTQATLLLELRATLDESKYQQFSFWFEQEFPNWPDMPLLTYQQTAELLAYASPAMVSQAVRNGSLLALGRGTPNAPRVPTLLVERYRQHAMLSKDNRGRSRPLPLIAWRERLWNEIREMNRIGTGSHPLTERTGVFALK